jgi:hypothetical protein
MLSTLGKRILLGRLITPLRYQFGGGHHHEIDYQAVVTKNEKSGTAPFHSRLLYEPQ